MTANISPFLSLKIITKLPPARSVKPVLEKIRFGIVPIANYKGVLLTKLKNGYKVFGQKVSTPQEVDVLIDNACESIKKSLV